jgi:hypothetical protein
LMAMHIFHFLYNQMNTSMNTSILTDDLFK